MAKKKVVVGMSGGVDSSVVAAILKNQGYDVVGVFMRFWQDTKADKAKNNFNENHCCSLGAYNDAKRVAEMLDIPFYAMDMKTPFKKTVVNYFLEEYKNGRTPNPCVECNRFIKFGEFLKKAKAMGADYVATGHYARLRREIQNPKSKTLNIKLLKGKDTEKDQSYFLYTLTQEKLKHILFPLGDYTKPKVRAMAKKFGLPVHSKKDSQEVCFVGDGLENFLSKWLKIKKGDIIEVETGKKLGEHRGLALYTIGQRKGLGLGGGPFYVVRMDAKKNILYVSNDEKRILSKELNIKKIDFISGFLPKLPLKIKVKIRYRHSEAPAILKKEKNNYKIIFNKPQRAITSGQSAVFYKGDEVLGGGVISER